MENVNCLICGSSEKDKIFSKNSGNGESFNLIKCNNCGLEYISPRPVIDEIGKYYGLEYFTKRTERGYNNYFSDDIKNEIERVIELNLSDLDFFEFEKSINGNKKSLDIGCAAGYFVGYLRARGWDSAGIDISGDCVKFAADSGLNVIEGDYLETDFGKKFDLITLWASIEHLHYPGRFLEKAHRELEDGGMLLVSTCRTGGMNFMKLFGRKWRFYNFPEHLVFFSRKTIGKILGQNKFKIMRYSAYGSGLGRGGSLLRKTADFMAKRFYLGDMMLIGARKVKDK